MKEKLKQVKEMYLLGFPKLKNTASGEFSVWLRLSTSFRARTPTKNDEEESFSAEFNKKVFSQLKRICSKSGLFNSSSSVLDFNFP